jgi:predicted nucleic acid-binding protein
VLPVQALGELFNVLVRKAKRPAAAARTAMLTWRDAYPLSDTSFTVMINAADLAADHHLGIWDSVIIAATAEAGCRLLLSEDLQEGFTWRGVTVTNPFAHTHHALTCCLTNATSGVRAGESFETPNSHGCLSAFRLLITGGPGGSVGSDVLLRPHEGNVARGCALRLVGGASHCSLVGRRYFNFRSIALAFALAGSSSTTRV